jgi:hypothetical protein
VCTWANGDDGQWCPAHSSSPAPPAMREVRVEDDQPAEQRMGDISLSIKSMANTRARSPLLVGCCHAGCNNLSGPSEAGLVANRRGVLCSGCGVARYCSRTCVLLGWPAHRHACGRLAAALGRNTASDGSSSSTATTSSTTTSSSDLRRKAQPAAAAGSCCNSRQAAATVPGAAPGTSGSSSSSADDTVPPKDQRPAAKVLVCAWCGAAWKAGHKQECAAAAAAAAFKI